MCKGWIVYTARISLSQIWSTVYLTTDAWKEAFAVILSQVKNGEERQIAYGIRQINRAKYNYSEWDMLAVVWEMKYFLCYLHGKKLSVRTEHAALSYIRNSQAVFPDWCVGALGYLNLTFLLNTNLALKFVTLTLQFEM